MHPVLPYSVTTLPTHVTTGVASLAPRGMGAAPAVPAVNAAAKAEVRDDHRGRHLDTRA